MNWKLTSEELPPCEVPVWLYDAERKLGPYIGCRTDDQDADGWLWARCYDSHWWDAKEQQWQAGDADEDDDHPTHWMPLPYPPKRHSADTPKRSQTTMNNPDTTPKPHQPEQPSPEGLDDTPCSALVDALIDVLPQHSMGCVSGLNLHDKPWSFDTTDDGRPLVTRDSCQCSGDSMRYLRGLLPNGHPKGFSQNAKSDSQSPAKTL